MGTIGGEGTGGKLMERRDSGGGMRRVLAVGVRTAPLSSGSGAAS